MVGLWPSSSMSTGCVVPLMGHFLPRWLRTDGLAECDQLGNVPWNIPLRSGIEPGPRRGQIMRYIHSPTELSWPGPQKEQTVRYTHSPTELSWPGPLRGQTVRHIHSPTELSWLLTLTLAQNKDNCGVISRNLRKKPSIVNPAASIKQWGDFQKESVTDSYCQCQHSRHAAL